MQKLLLFIFPLLSFTITFGQNISQIGYYYKNAVFDVDSKLQYMVLSNGDIVDNSIPSSPVLVGQYGVSNGFSVLVDGNYGYFGTGMANKLHIANLSNVSFPIHESTLSFNEGSGIIGMDVSGNILYLARGTNGILCSVDVSNKSVPMVKDELFIPGGQCRDIVIHNNYGFAAHYDGLKVIDISDPSDLKVAASIGNIYNSVVADGNLAFLGKLQGGVDVFDVSTPTSPIPLYSILGSGGSVHELKYHDNRLLLATDTGGLYIYKADSISATLEVQFPNTGNGQSHSIAVQDNLLLLSGAVNGVAILEFEGTTGIPAIADSSYEIGLFPNPATNSISLHSNYNITNIQFLDTFGRIVKQINSYKSSDQIDVSELAIGTYYLKIETEDKTFVKELIKVE